MPARIESLPRDTTPESVLSALQRDGGVIVEGFVPPEKLGRLNEDLEALIEKSVPGDRSSNETSQAFHGHNTIRFTRLALHSSVFVDLMLDPLLLSYAEHFLTPNCAEFWLNTAQAIVVGPGEPAQVLHFDDDIWPHLQWKDNLSAGAMVALSDFTRHNGATRIVPGSHRWPRERRPTTEEITQAVMPAGSIVLYLGRTLHGAGENTTQSWRRGMHIGYMLGWLRPEENHQLAIPLHTARQLPTRAQTLLGFRGYFPDDGNALGLVDYKDPSFIMDETR